MCRGTDRAGAMALVAVLLWLATLPLALLTGSAARGDSTAENDDLVANRLRAAATVLEDPTSTGELRELTIDPDKEY